MRWKEARQIPRVRILAVGEAVIIATNALPRQDFREFPDECLKSISGDRRPQKG